MPSIDRNSSVPFYQQVYEQIAHGIENGVYPAGKKLPSIRECARELGVSNTTVELAYQRLTAEGYVQARRGSGYTICAVELVPASPFERFTAEYQNNLDALIAQEQNRANVETPVFDFAYDSVDASLFPFTTWARICREVFFSLDSNEACLYNDRQGLYSLREQIAKYLGGEHGLNCVPEQVLVMPTTRDLVSEIVALFNPQETVVAMGNPGYDEVGARLRERGYQLKEIPVFPYPTWNEMKAAIEGATIVFATPVSQFPTNQTMSLEMRTELVTWAKEHDAYLIDDEYGCEFQSGIVRSPVLSALDDEGRVITLGTFSNSFTPAVCLSYAVLPPQLMLKWREKRLGTHPQVPWQTQAAMTAFMRDDHWRTHIRKMRTAIVNKRIQLAKSVKTHLGDTVRVVESESSLFVLMQTVDGRKEDELIEAAARVGVRVYPTSQYWTGNPPADWRYVLVGYAGIPANDIDAGIRALANAWSL